MQADIIDRLKSAEAKAGGEVREAIHDAWKEILWLREGVELSKRAVEIAEAKVPNASGKPTTEAAKPL